jgi:hypothetical protein
MAQKPSALDPVRILVKEGRIIDAASMPQMRDGLDLTTASAWVDELRNAPRPQVQFMRRKLARVVR